MTQPLISVVVLAYNQFEKTTLPCLDSLTPWLTDTDLEFIVYDNASPDGSGAKAGQWCAKHPTVRYIQSPSNLGYAGGMNAAASQTSGRWLFLVNNDTEFAPHAIDALKRVLSSAPPNMAMIGPVTNAAGNGQRLYDPSKTKEEWLELGAWLNTNPTGLLLPTYRCDFFCIAIRRDAWDRLNGLDTIFGMGYFEDFDFSLRLRDAGYDQAITEDVFIYHQGSESFKIAPEMKQLIKKNKTVMQERHRGVCFLHVRDCNLALWKMYTCYLSHGLDESLSYRESLRWNSAICDLPKSPIKRIYWKVRLMLLSRRSIK